MSCGAGRRRGLEPALLWLWWRLVATALIRPLAWETPYALAKRLKKKKKKNENVRDSVLEGLGSQNNY